MFSERRGFHRSPRPERQILCGETEYISLVIYNTIEAAAKDTVGLIGSYSLTADPDLSDFISGVIDLDQNGTPDIKIALCTMDTDLYLWRLDTCSVGGEFKIKLPFEEKVRLNQSDHAFYSSLTFRLCVPLEKAEVTLEPAVFAYNGSKCQPKVKLVYGGKTLVEGTDYSVSYANNTLPGTADVIISSSNNGFIGSKLVHFTIGKGNQTVNVPSVSLKKTILDSAFALRASTNGNGTIRYSSDNTKVAAVDSGGKVTIRGIGTANIKIWAEASDTYTKSGEKKVTVTVSKAANPLRIKAKKVSVSYSKLKKKKQTLKVSRVLKFTKKGKGKLTYALSSAKKGKKNVKKYFKVNSRNGKVTIGKGLKKGKYTVKVRVKAAGDAKYKASKVKKVTFTITVK